MSHVRQPGMSDNLMDPLYVHVYIRMYIKTQCKYAEQQQSAGRGRA